MAGVVQSISHLGLKSHACLNQFLFQGLDLSTSKAEVFTASVRVTATSCALLLHKPDLLLVHAPSLSRTACCRRPAGLLSQPHLLPENSGDFAQ